MRLEWPNPWSPKAKSPALQTEWLTLPVDYDRAIEELGVVMQDAGQIRAGAGPKELYREALKAALSDGLASRREGLELTAALAAERAVMVAAQGSK